MQHRRRISKAPHRLLFGEIARSAEHDDSRVLLKLHGAIEIRLVSNNKSRERTLCARACLNCSLLCVTNVEQGSIRAQAWWGFLEMALTSP